MKKKNKIQNIYIFCGILFWCLSHGYSQNGLTLPSQLKKDKIPFELVNNLVIIPVEVNGAKLSFLLDSGVNTTILFGITEVDSLRVNNARPVKVRGLGEGEGVVALHSQNNEVRIGAATDYNHPVYVIFEETLNFSTRMGIPIHGIIGYDFFKNFVVKTDYISKKITFYNPATYKKKKCYQCEEFNITFHNNKPYIDIRMSSPNSPKEITLLLDSGSSDALWLFDEAEVLTNESKKYFEDFLGLGFSGNIFGKRSKLDEIWLGSFNLKEVKVAFPDIKATEGIKFFEERDGSIGGDILKRFTVILDYPSGKMILKKNSNYSDPFFYNMAGLTIEHEGLDVVTELTTHRNFNFFDTAGASNNGTGSQSITDVSVYTQFALVPRYVVVEVREDSPAQLAGIKIGDEIVTVNGAPAYNIKLFKLNTMFSSKVGKRLNLGVKRNQKTFKAKFTLKKVL